MVIDCSDTKLFSSENNVKIISANFKKNDVISTSIYL